MIKKFSNFLQTLRDGQRIAIALSKGAAMMSARQLSLSDPASWEFSGFSQNGEDGILDVLRRQLVAANRYFIEIGSADGIENCTAWLAVAEKYSGLMIEGDSQLVERAQRGGLANNLGVECRNMYVTLGSVHEIKAMALYSDPDILSLDIDGNDYYVANAILDAGLLPKIWVVEYNSAFGADRCMTIEYGEKFSFKEAHPTHLYYGVSIAGWRKLFENRGYRFVTVDRNGVNAFFVDPRYFDTAFLDGIKGLEFAENFYQRMKFRGESDKQFALIADQNFVSI